MLYNNNTFENIKYNGIIIMIIMMINMMLLSSATAIFFWTCWQHCASLSYIYF